jgi:hypothetical protein
MFKSISTAWRGDAPFWLSIFGFSLLLPWILVFGGVSWLSSYTMDVTPWASIRAALFVFSIVAVVGIWQLVGTWRATSATKAPNRRWISRWFGRTAALISFALCAFAFMTMPSNVAGYYAEATDADWIGQKGHSLTVEDDAIVVSGFMSWGLHDKFVAALAENPDIKTVVLDSPGGHYGVGLRMSRMIRERGLDTLTTDMCGSACTYAFLGGENRMLRRGARLGFHAMAGNTPIVIERMQGHAADALRAANVPDEFIERIFATPSEDVWYPTVKELRAANVVTEITD